MKRILSIVLTLALLLTALPLALSVSAAETFTYDFSKFSGSSTQYAEETHMLSDDITLSITDCHINTQLRIYSSTTNNGIAVFSSKSNLITAIKVSAGYKKDTINIYGSTDGVTYTSSTIETITTTSTSYKDYTATFSQGYKYIKLDVAGSNQVRIASIEFTTEVDSSGGNEPDTPECKHTGETSYDKTDSEHWLICDDCSKEIANSREEHDFSNGDCICGQTAPTPVTPDGNSYYITATLGETKYYATTQLSSGKGVSTDQIANAGIFYIDTNGSTAYIYYKDGDTKMYLTISGSSSSGVSFVANTPCEFTPGTVNGVATYIPSNNRVLTLYADKQDIRTYLTTYNDFTNNPVMTFEVISATPECTHENTTTTNTATYFKDGKVTVVCDDCGETVSETEATATDVALDEENCKVEFANGNLTITLTYSEDLYKDIDKDNGAVISFNYSIGEYSNSIEIPTGIAAKVTLEGFNADRLNAQLEYYLTAVYDGVTTDKLVNATKNTLTVAEKVDSKTKDLITALNADGANTVVSAEIGATTHFAENTITADIKAGTMVLNFIASDELVAKLGENKAYARTNKITVTIDGVANEYVFTPDVMRKSTTIKISGMSFAQLNGKVTVKVEFIYNDDSVEDITDTITFEGAKAVEATNSDVATAFKNYIEG